MAQLIFYFLYNGFVDLYSVQTRNHIVQSFAIPFLNLTSGCVQKIKRNNSITLLHLKNLVMVIFNLKLLYLKLQL